MAKLLFNDDSGVGSELLRDDLSYDDAIMACEKLGKLLDAIHNRAIRVAPIGVSSEARDDAQRQIITAMPEWSALTASHPFFDNDPITLGINCFRPTVSVE